VNFWQASNFIIIFLAEWCPISLTATFLGQFSPPNSTWANVQVRLARSNMTLCSWLEHPYITATDSTLRKSTGIQWQLWNEKEEETCCSRSAQTSESSFIMNTKGDTKNVALIISLISVFCLTLLLSIGNGAGFRKFDAIFMDKKVSLLPQWKDCSWAIKWAWARNTPWTSLQQVGLSPFGRSFSFGSSSLTHFVRKMFIWIAFNHIMCCLDVISIFKESPSGGKLYLNPEICSKPYLIISIINFLLVSSW